MKIRIIFVWFFLLVCHLQVKGQIRYGLDLSLTSSTFVNISPDTLEPYGNSGAVFTQKPSYRINPTFLIRKDLNQKLSFEGGIGYVAIKHQLRQKFYHELRNFNVDDTLFISLHYIQLPMSLNYGVRLNDKSKVLFSGAIKFKILISGKDNGNNLIFEAIDLGDSNYKPIVITPGAAIAWQRVLINGNTFEVGLFGNMDASPVFSQDWGFYGNLKPGRFLQIGLNCKYFL